MNNKSKWFNSKFIGAVCMIAGTAIGAGMLALPVATSFMGTAPSLLLFTACWLLMLVSAYFFMDISLGSKGEHNFISIVKKYIGKWSCISWIFYFGLLYSLTSAYIAGSSSIFGSIIKCITGTEVPVWISSLCLPIIFSPFVCKGMSGVDRINKILVFLLFAAYVCLIISLPGKIIPTRFTHLDPKCAIIGLSLVVTSFGYHSIIPTIENYLDHDRRATKMAIFVGSCIPLVIYIIWQLLVLGTVPIGGKFGLLSVWDKGGLVTDALTQVAPGSVISVAATLFAFFAIVTSFLGVSVSLFDSISGGFNLQKKKLIALILTFGPPICFIFIYSRGFVVALEYAGICVAFLLIMLPAIFAWRLKDRPFYKTIRCRLLILVAIFLAAFIATVDVFDQFGCFDWMLDSYRLK